MAFTNISIAELKKWCEVFQEDGITEPSEMFTEITLIDDLLTLQRSQSLLNRKKNLCAQLDARIGLEFGIKPINLNRK